MKFIWFMVSMVIAIAVTEFVIWISPWGKGDE